MNHLRPLLLLAPFTTLPCGNALAGDVAFAVGMRHFDYKEFSLTGDTLNTETGLIPGATASLRESSTGFTHTLEIGAWDGRVDYNGRTQSGKTHNTQTDETLYQLLYRLDWQPREMNGALYASVSWNNWDRDIQPANGVDGLFERYRWYALEAGLHANLYREDRSTVFVEIGVQATRAGTIEIHLQDAGYGLQTLDLGDGFGNTARAGWNWDLDSASSVRMALHYTNWNFGRSNSKAISNGSNIISITEPESRSQYTSFSIAYVVAF